MTPRPPHPSGTLAVFGHPIAHSLSPAMHGAALAALGLAGRVSYVARDVAPFELRAAVDEVRAGRLLGASVTLPHKRAVMALVDRVEPDAAAIGAVNTLVRAEGGTLAGANTDAPGLVRALGESGAVLRGARALVIGAGGAARAAVVALARTGVAHVDVAARRRAEAEALVTSLSGLVAPAAPEDGLEAGPAAHRTGARPEADRSGDRTGLEPGLTGASLATLDLEPHALAGPAPSTTLVIQATSATLDEASGAALAALLPLAALPASTLVCDLVYRPRRTAVLRAAEAHGLRTQDGVAMLVHQGALALERWLGVEAPVEVMRAAVLAALAGEPRGVD